MVPFLEVAHLASSSSFYSAILQPLGLRYISDPELDSELSSPVAGPCIAYGTSRPPTPVFQLRQVANPRPSRIVLTAETPTAVTDFRRCALRANPDTKLSTSALVTLGATEPVSTGQSCAKVTDFDGNVMEIVYLPPPSTPGSRYGASTVRRTQSTSAEASRVLNWNYGVALSSAATVVRGRGDSDEQYSQHDEPYMTSRKAVTTSSVLYDAGASSRQNPSGLGAGSVIGALLGVAAGAAAGAALTYSMVQRDRARAPQQEFDPPPFARRATFPNAPYLTERAPRYVEVERTVERVRYPHDYDPMSMGARHPSPEYRAPYGQGGTPRGSTREIDELSDDARSRHSSRHSGSRGGVRTRSEAATARMPLLLTDTEHRSHAGSSSSKYGNQPPITRSTVSRSHTFDMSDRQSYASARSRHSHSTIRPSPPLIAPLPIAAARSSIATRSTSSNINMPSHGHVPRGHSTSRAGSYVSARNVPLPASAVGSSHADWYDDDRSVVPDDSISCVGSRRSGRSHLG